MAKRHTLVIRNVGTVDQVIYVGLAGVAANTGFRLYSKESKTIPLVPGLAIYVIAGENVAYDVEEYA